MNSIYFITKQFQPFKKLSFLTKKSYQLRANYGFVEAKHPLTKVLKQIISILIYPFVLLVKMKRTSASCLIFEPNEAAIALRKKHLEIYLEIAPEAIAVVNDKRFYYSNWSFGKIASALSIWFSFLKMIPLLLFHSNKQSAYVYYPYVLNVLVQTVLIDPKQLVFFQPQRLDTVIAATCLDGMKKAGHIVKYFTTGDAISYAYCRYLNLPNFHILCNGSCCFEEFESYTRIHWVKAKSLILTGPENNLKPKTIKPTFKYDIGLYSSGSWARINGLIRAKDIEKVRSYFYKENPLYTAFSTILDIVFLLRAEKQITVKVYLHPMEKALYRMHKIEPPYFKLLKEHGIVTDIDDENISLEQRMYEAHIGISYQSTMINERWAHGLIGLRTSVMGNLKLPLQYFPTFAEQTFEEWIELNDLIKRFLN